MAPSKCLSKWIKGDKWDYFKNSPQDLFSLLIFIYFFEYETIVRSSAWSFGHSDPDPSSVNKTPKKTGFITAVMDWVGSVSVCECIVRNSIHKDLVF